MAADAKRLITQAFWLAQQRGKTDWSRMTVAVLKNRMIQLTHGDFDESRFGARTIRELVAQFPDLVKLEEDGAVVRFLGSLESTPATAVGSEHVGTGRLREDLWRAVMDYSSGATYVWNGVKAVVQEATDGDELRLPTITATELAQWRADFVAQVIGTLPAESAERVREWQEEALSTIALPGPLRAHWSAEMKRRATERVLGWFQQRGITPPGDLFQANELESSTPIETMRATIIECVKVMTEEELADLRLPPSAVARARARIGKVR